MISVRKTFKDALEKKYSCTTRPGEESLLDVSTEVLAEDDSLPQWLQHPVISHHGHSSHPAVAGTRTSVNWQCKLAFKVPELAGARLGGLGPKPCEVIPNWPPWETPQHHCRACPDTPWAPVALQPSLSPALHRMAALPAQLQPQTPEELVLALHP